MLPVRRALSICLTYFKTRASEIFYQHASRAVWGFRKTGLEGEAAVPKRYKRRAKARIPASCVLPRLLEVLRARCSKHLLTKGSEPRIQRICIWLAALSTWRAALCITLSASRRNPHSAPGALVLPLFFFSWHSSITLLHREAAFLDPMSTNKNAFFALQECRFGFYANKYSH